MWPFLGFVIAHIISGTAGLILFWVPVIARKGGASHRKYGRWFAWSMMITGSIAVAIATCSLLTPLETHRDFTDAALVRGLFGWMMLYLAILTVSLGWHSLATINFKFDHSRHRNPMSIGIQVLLLAAAVQCVAQGIALQQPLMLGISVIGFLSSISTLAFIAWPRPHPAAHLIEHVKAGVGAGISAYTAFLSVGLVRVMPDHAFNPLIWAIPTVIGVSLIVWHWTLILQTSTRAGSGRPGRPPRINQGTT
jgi:hypothetical protein